MTNKNSKSTSPIEFRWIGVWESNCERFPPKEPKRLVAGITDRDIYIGENNWRIKRKQLSHVDVDDMKLTLQSLDGRRIELHYSHVNDHLVKEFIRICQSTLDKYNGKDDTMDKSNTSKYLQSSTVLSRKINHKTNKNSKRRTFGKAASTGTSRKTMPWDDDEMIYDGGRKNINLSQRKGLHDDVEEIYQESVDENNNSRIDSYHQLKQEDEGAEDELTHEIKNSYDDNDSNDEIDPELSPVNVKKEDTPQNSINAHNTTSATTTKAYPWSSAGFTVVPKSDTKNKVIEKPDNSNDQNIIQNEEDTGGTMTTPQTHRLVSPLTAPRLSPDEDDDSNSNNEEQSLPKIDNQKSISSFFQVKRNRKLSDHTNPASTPPRRNEKDDDTQQKLINSHVTRQSKSPSLMTSRKRPIGTTYDWLSSKSPADSAVVSTEKQRPGNLFGIIPSPLTHNVQNNQTKLDFEYEDPIKEYPDSPERFTVNSGRRRTLKRFRLHSNEEKIDEPDNTTTTTVTNEDNSFQLTAKSNELDSKPTRPERRKDISYRGLRNLGNTCYINASVQMLVSCRSFVSSLHGCSGSLASSLVSVADKLSIVPSFKVGGSFANAVNPIAIKEAIDSKTDKFRGFEQRDAHEFLNDLLDNIHQELEENESSNQKDAPDDSKVNDMTTSSPLPTDMFCMKVEVCLECKSCQYRRSKVELYRNLSIDVVNTTPDEGKLVNASIELGLEQFFKPEIREVNCEKCQEGTHAFQTQKILSRPKLLLLHLKRFLVVERTIEKEGKENESPNIQRRTATEYVFLKSRAAVSIPPLLTLQQYEKNEDEDEDKHVSTISPQDASLSTYHLQSIVNHMGSRASSGHYTADALREKMLVQQNEEKGDTVNNSDIPSQEIEDGCNSDESHPVWVSYDDDMAYIMTLEKILKKKQESAYMVLYSLD